MPIQVYVIAAFILTPILFGVIGGVSTWWDNAPTYTMTSWRLPVQQPVFEENGVENDESKEKDLITLEEILDAVDCSMEQALTFEKSTPSREMESSIQELLTKVLPEQNNEDESTNAISSNTEKTELGINNSESVFSGENEIFTSLAKESEVVNSMSMVDLIPSPLPLNEFQMIAKHYGNPIASIITTTPGQGPTGQIDVMIGRLKETVAGYVLSYGDYFIPLTGNYPRDEVGNVVLVKGYFYSPTEFFVFKTVDPEKLLSSLPFHEDMEEAV